MISGIIDFVWDIFKEFFKLVWELVIEFVKLLVTDLWEILLAIAIVILLWYASGGYDKAEQNYQAQKKSSDAQAQIQEQLDAQKAQNPDAGIYIVH